MGMGRSSAFDALIDSGAVLSSLKTHWWHKLRVISELHRQQTILLYAKTRSIPDQIMNWFSDRFGLRFAARRKLQLSLALKSEFLCGMALPFCIGSAGIHTTDRGTAATPNESALIASISIPRIKTSAPETTYDYLASGWVGHRKIQSSPLLTSSSLGRDNSKQVCPRIRLVAQKAPGQPPRHEPLSAQARTFRFSNACPALTSRSPSTPCHEPANIRH
jgi:hypothetical protein